MNIEGMRFDAAYIPSNNPIANAIHGRENLDDKVNACFHETKNTKIVRNYINLTDI